MTETQIARMEAKAIEQRWPITQEYREAIIKRLMRIAVDQKSTPREVTSAAKALMAAESQNIADQQHADTRMDTQRNRILDLLAARGAGSSYIDAERGGGSIIEAGGARVLRGSAD